MRRLSVIALLLIAVSVHAQTRRRAQMPGYQAPTCPPSTKLNAGTIGYDVDVDGDVVYFASYDGMYRWAPKKDTLSWIAQLPQPLLFVLDQQNVYVLTVDGTLWSIAKSGPSRKILVSNILTPFDLGIDETSLYFVSLGTPSGRSYLADGKVYRVGKDGTGLLAIASNLNTPAAVISDGTNAYFVESGQSTANTSSGVRAVPVGGGTMRSLTNGTPGIVLAQNDTDIFFATFGKANQTMQRVPKSGGTAQTVISNLGFVSKVVVFRDSLYYVNSTDTHDHIERYSLTDGGDPTVVIDSLLNTQEFALDDCSVYWLDALGAVRRDPR
jgi:hypothetical protein